MRLYVYPTSPNVRRARLAAAVLGLELEETLVDFSKGEHKKPESGLLPQDEQARADVMRWQFWDSSHFSPPLGTVAFQRIMKQRFGMGEPDESKVSEALSNFRRFAAVLDKRLDGKRYVVGDSLTLADLTIATSLMYAEQSEVPVAEFPNVHAWFSRISEMDAWKRTSPFGP